MMEDQLKALIKSIINELDNEDILEANIKLLEGGMMPIRATDGSAGYDCYARKVEYSENQIKYYLGFSVEFNKDICALVLPRSSVSKTGLRMANSIGLCDSDYRGEYSAVFDRKGRYQYEVGDRCCQILFLELPKIELVQVDELSETKRGAGGYGSTGK